MLRNLLSNKFYYPNQLISEGSGNFKFVLLFICCLICGSASSQDSYKMYFGINPHKIWLSSDNLSTSSISTTRPSISPLFGFEFKRNNTSLAVELSFFKTNYNNELKYRDKFQDNVINTTWKARFIAFAICAKQNLLNTSKSSINVITKLNILNNSTPFDQRTAIFGPDTYTLFSHTKANLGYFYSLSLGMEYQFQFNERMGFIVSSQINSNLNRTLVEEINTIAYPDGSLAYQFLKVNGRSANINVGLTYKIRKRKPQTKPNL